MYCKRVYMSERKHLVRSTSTILGSKACFMIRKLKNFYINVSLLVAGNTGEGPKCRQRHRIIFRDFNTRIPVKQNASRNM